MPCVKSLTKPSRPSLRPANVSRPTPAAIPPSVYQTLLSDPPVTEVGANPAVTGHKLKTGTGSVGVILSSWNRSWAALAPAGTAASMIAHAAAASIPVRGTRGRERRLVL
jgi:hypothetical protein